MRQEQIPGVLRKLLWIRFCALPVRSRHDHQLVHMLDVPSTLAEFDGKPVEQLGMSGPLAHDAEVFGSFDDAGSEKLIPHAVYRHSRGERIGGTHGPLG